MINETSVAANQRTPTLLGNESKLFSTPNTSLSGNETIVSTTLNSEAPVTPNILTSSPNESLPATHKTASSSSTDASITPNTTSSLLDDELHNIAEVSSTSANMPSSDIDANKPLTNATEENEPKVLPTQRTPLLSVAFDDFRLPNQSGDVLVSGCFHGNKTYETGEIFFLGCEYKCICREGGLTECEERCPIYIDTVGYENCEWGPAPEDPCCTVPLCDKENKKPLPHDSNSEPFCMSEGGKVFAVGQSWESGTNCMKKFCQCAILPNGTTTVRCRGGCAPLPANAMQPTPECPDPRLITPDHECLCPYVVCNNNLNRKRFPRKTELVFLLCR